ncbi:MAG: DUF1573 domain-containing protein [Cyclobacteriaceae bacterium]|nr:DUF1573 domain-containing protein [Cyclobacteriaceae bacterium]
MKKVAFTFLILVVAFVGMAHSWAVNSKPSGKLSSTIAVFHWSSTTIDFGKIPVGKPVTHQFTFTNEGNVPLVISSVQASCGCTVAEYSKEPIAPGGQGFVKATYNAAKAGVFTKTVSVNANTEEGVVQLFIKGEVVE